MKIDIKNNRVEARCIKCGESFYMKPEAFVRGSFTAKTTCPKCRGLTKGRRKKK